MIKKLIALIIAASALSGLTGIDVEVSEIFNTTEYSQEQKETAAEIVYDQLSRTFDKMTSGEEVYERQPNSYRY